MSTKSDLKAGLKALREALTDRLGEFNSGTVGARWSGATLRSAGIGPARKRKAWTALAEEPSGGTGVVTALGTAADAVKSTNASGAGSALTKAEDALSRLEALLGL